MNVAVPPAASSGAIQPEFEIGPPPEAVVSSAAIVPVEFVSGSASAQTTKRAYPLPAETPTQAGPKGFRFDFNDGCRVVLEEAEHPWRVRVSDLDTGNTLFETELKTGRVNSSKRYYVRFRVEAWQNDASVFVHDYWPRTATYSFSFRSARWATRSAGFPMR